MFVELLEKKIEEDGRDKFLIPINVTNENSVEVVECINEFINNYLKGKKNITVADRVDNVNTLNYFRDKLNNCPRILSIIKKKLKPEHFQKCEKNLRSSLGYIYVYKIPDFFNKSIKVPSLNARSKDGSRKGKLTFREGTNLYLKIQFFENKKGIFPKEGYLKVDPIMMVLNYASCHPSP